MLSNGQDAGDRARMRQMSSCFRGAYVLEGRDLGQTRESRDGQDPGRCLKELGSRLERVAGQMKAGRENRMGSEAWHV